MVEIELAKNLFDEAKKYIPGGVNSPVRSFKAVGGAPLFIKEGKGSKIYAECGGHVLRSQTRNLSSEAEHNKYSAKEEQFGEGGEFIDYCMSWGAMILGHARPEITEALLAAVKKGTSFGTATKLETELAKLIAEAVPSVERVRLTNSGTEAVMGAIRIARAYTNRDKIIKFEGAYHGHADYLLVKSGSGQATLGIPASRGVPKDFIKHTLVIPYNDIIRLREAVKKYQKELAAIIVEPVLANCGVVLPKDGFLQDLRKLADEYGIILIFDEVITGFRLSYSGAQGYFNVKPDLTCLGKIAGGGLPLGAFGGRKEIMRLLAPEGQVYQAGTLSGNPIAVTAGITTLNILKHDNPYSDLEEKTKGFCEKIKEIAVNAKLQLKVNYIGSMFSLFFTDGQKSFGKFFHGLLKNGVYFSPSGFEANFLSTAHSEEDLDRTLDIIGLSLNTLRREQNGNSNLCKRQKRGNCESADHTGPFRHKED